MRKKFIALGLLSVIALAAAWFLREPLLKQFRGGPPQPDAAAPEQAAEIADLDAPHLLRLLKDPKPEVRRSAILALGEMKEAVPDEDLLPSLHDPDEGVRDLCEAALRWRGLGEKDIQMGRLVSDPSPLKRLQVLQQLPADNELDPQLWLQKLCQDPSPAVRASAVRAALDPDSGLHVNLTDRVRHMAQHDPDGTVRQIAEFLLQEQQKPGNGELK